MSTARALKQIDGLPEFLPGPTEAQDLRLAGSNGEALSGARYSPTATEAEAEAERAQALLSSVAGGDSAAFWILWERYRRYLYAVCLKHMKGVPEDAEDALSRAMLKAWDRLPRYAGTIIDPKRWLVRLTHNLCIEIHRERSRLTTRFHSIENMPVEPVARSIDSPEQALLQREMYAYIRRTIEELPQPLREPFALRFLHEMPYRDIAQRLALTVENVRKRIQQGRKILEGQVRSYMAGLRGPAPNRLELSTPLVNAANSGQLLASPRTFCGQSDKPRRVCAVQVTLPSQLEMDFYLMLDCKPTRQALKLKTLIKYVQRHPKGWKKRIELAHHLYTMGHWQEALEQYDRALERQPRSIEAWREVGEILRLMERGEEAIAAYEQALFFAGSPSIRCQVAGLVEACSNRLESAARKFEAAGWPDASASACWHTLGLISLRLERPAQALEAFEKALAANPDDVAALTYSHDALTMIGRLREGLRRVMRALELSPDNVLALKTVSDHRCRMGSVYGEEGRTTRNMIRQTLLFAPDAADGHESKALFHVWRGQWKKGIEVLASYTQRHPKNPRGWYHLARCLFRTGESEAAARAIITARALHESDIDINRAMCQILAHAGMLEALWPLLLEVPERFPDQWSILTRVGRTMARWFPERDLACALSSQAPRLQARLPQAWFGHGRVLALSGKHEEAIVALEEGWQWLPEDEGYDHSAPAAAWLAESYRALGEQSKSRSWWEAAAYHASELIAQSPSIGHYWQGKALESMGDAEGAVRAFRSALNENLLYPERQVALVLLAHLGSGNELSIPCFEPVSEGSESRKNSRIALSNRLL